MKNQFVILRVLLAVLMLSMLYYCSKDSTKEVTPPAVKISLPTVTTTAALTITSTGATLGGNVTSDGNATVTERGVVYATTQTPTTSNTKVAVGTGTGTFTTNVTGLTAGTTYYVRAYATNSQGTSYGSQETFNVSTILPIINAGSFSSIKVSGTTVANNENISLTGKTSFTLSWTANKGNANLRTIRITRDAKPITDQYGYHWYGDDLHSQADATQYSTWNDTIVLPALSGTYDITLWDADTNSIEFIFTLTATPPPNQIIDVDWNIYHTVTIGSQTWMVENLSTTKYNDGYDIPYESDTYNWRALTTAARCNYPEWGFRLYNWYAVNTGKLAPIGWHVATDEDWTTLQNYVASNLGTSPSVAKALAATTNWSTSTTTDATGNNLAKNNSTGFSALPSGSRSDLGYFNDVGNTGIWWTSTGNLCREIDYYGKNLFKLSVVSTCGLAVRCVKN